MTNSKNNKKILKFPKGFFWGTATSSHQIEGNNTANDWWRAEELGKIKYKSGQAADSYNRYEEDFDLARDMHNNAHRFSIEWSRIEPREGEFDEKEIEHYRRVIQALRGRGMEPFVTLHHFTNPIWFADYGGWQNKKAPFYFARYAEYVVKNLGDEVKYWITINEPLIYIFMASLGMGPWTDWPDSEKNYKKGIRMAKNLTRAHILTTEKIKLLNKEFLVGVAKSNPYFEAYNNQFFSRMVVLIAKYIRNHWFLNKINKYQDFVGINYYSHDRVRASFSHPEKWFIGHNDNKKVSDMGFEIYPEGIYHVVKQVTRYKKPIFIFENGVADADDDQRPKFIKDHLRWLHKAISEGADVRGYFHWSLLDNFEWAEGFNQRFGLIEVDFNTFERKPRKSSKIYGEICKTNTLEV